MSSGQLEFEPSSLRKAAAGMDEASAELLGKAQALLAEVGDVSALGTYDTLGSLASALYSAVLARVQETVDSVATQLGEHGGALSEAASAYQATEEAAATMGSATFEGGSR